MSIASAIAEITVSMSFSEGTKDPSLLESVREEAKENKVRDRSVVKTFIVFIKLYIFLGSLS